MYFLGKIRIRIILYKKSTKCTICLKMLCLEAVTRQDDIFPDQPETAVQERCFYYKLIRCAIAGQRQALWPWCVRMCVGVCFLQLSGLFKTDYGSRGPSWVSLASISVRGRGVFPFHIQTPFLPEGGGGGVLVHLLRLRTSVKTKEKWLLVAPDVSPLFLDCPKWV